jgi:hypothetical protein
MPSEILLHSSSHKPPGEENEGEDDDDERSSLAVPQFTSQVSFSRSSDYYNQRDELEEERSSRERLFQFNIYSFLHKQLKRAMVGKLFRKKVKNNYYNSASKSSSSSIGSSKSKHVIFADSLGLDLELIHTIQLANTQNLNRLDSEDCLVEFRKVTLTKQTTTFFSSSYSEFDTINESDMNTFFGSIHMRSQNMTLNQKTLIPRFVLSPDVNYKKLIANGICLNSVEVFNQASIRGIILTLNKPESTTTSSIELQDAPTIVRRHSSLRLLKRFSKLFKFNATEMSSSASVTPNPASKLDLVYVIWSMNDWKSWKYHAAIQKNCKATHSNSGIIKTHEFFIQNLDHILDIDNTLQLIICHQVDTVVFKDMMDPGAEACYNFKCAYQI